MNREYPCICGYRGDAQRECICTPSAVSRYQKKISGPITDRFDTHNACIGVPRVEYEKLADERLGEPSGNIQQRVEAARRRQQGRFEHLDSVTTNADTRTRAEALQSRKRAERRPRP